MFFAKIAAVACLTLSVVAAPVSVGFGNKIVARAPTDEVTTILKQLQTDMTPALANLTALAENGVESLTQDALAPVLKTVTDLIDKATTSIGTLNVDASVALKRDGAVGDVAQLASGVIGDVFTALNTLKGVPVLGDLLPAVESSLSGLIGGLNSVLAGLLAVLNPLLSPVLDIANGLGLGGLLGGLGL